LRVPPASDGFSAWHAVSAEGVALGHGPDFIGGRFGEEYVD
jgi:hypothetical protein